MRIRDGIESEGALKTSKILRFTYVTEHRYVTGLSDYSLDVAGAFRSEEGYDPVADHVDHRTGSFDGLSPRVAPSHHQLHIRQKIRIVVDLKHIRNIVPCQFHVKINALPKMGESLTPRKNIRCYIIRVKRFIVKT